MNGALTRRVRRRLTAAAHRPSRAAVVAAVRAETPDVVLGDTQVLALADQVHEELVGAGPLSPLLADDAVTDVLVNGVAVWADRSAGLRPAAVRFDSPQQVRALAQRLAAACGRRLDDGCPFADARLPDGTRVHAVLPPVAVDGPYLSLRTHRRQRLDLAGLVAAGALGEPTAALLRAVVAARLAFLVTGGTGTGKTTLLSCLLALVPADERIVVVEDAAELRPDHPHAVTLECRTANVEGAGAVDLRQLVRHALRMRPDRLVVGECRGGEVVDLLAALNTGHDGGAGTLHANSAADVPARLTALGMTGGWGPATLAAQARAALRVVIHVGRRGGARVVESVGVLGAGTDGGMAVRPAWRSADGAGPAAPALAELLAERGVRPPALLRGHG